MYERCTVLLFMTGLLQRLIMTVSLQKKHIGYFLQNFVTKLLNLYAKSIK